MNFEKGVGAPSKLLVEAQAKMTSNKSPKGSESEF